MADLTVPLSRFGLRGRIVTLDDDRRVVADGVVWVADGSIVGIGRPSDPPPAECAGLTATRTSGTIYPGLIELHNHLVYNAIPLWRPLKRYTNRDQWSHIVGYRRHISGPTWLLGSNPLFLPSLIRYAECKSLVAGVTTSQGITLRTERLVHHFRGLIRNCEVPDNDELPAALTKIQDLKVGEAPSFAKRINGPRTMLLHLAEGTDDDARDTFERLRATPGDDGQWAITPHLAGIHGTALSPEQITRFADGGSHLVWSPFSNLALYGETTKIEQVIEAGINVSLGSDWAPSGTKNLLGELKVARLYLDSIGSGVTDRQLVEMVTRNPAATLGWSARLGSIEVGKLADLTVIDGTVGDPYERLIATRERAVQLVVIDGVARFGPRSLLSSLSPISDTITIAGRARSLYLDPRPGVPADPVVPTPPLASEAINLLTDALARLPELARAAGPVGLVGAIPGSEDFTEGRPRTATWVAELDEDPPGPGDLVPGWLAAATLGSTTFAQLAVAKKLDPLAIEGDDEFFDTLANLAAMPEFIRRELPAFYGIDPHEPADAVDLLDRDGDGDPLRPLYRLDELMAGEFPGHRPLTVEERTNIVDQAIVLLDQIYVHLPLKRAMHAVDPLQRLRLLRHRLAAQSTSAADAHGPGPEPDLAFHHEITEIFATVRDLHTHYVLPEPYRSHYAMLPFLVEEYWDGARHRYLVTSVTKPATGRRHHPTFVVGVEVTHWNGVPITTAVRRLGERQPAGNPDARRSRALDALTIRPLGRAVTPDEAWVRVTYVGLDGTTHDVERRWESGLTDTRHDTAIDALDSSLGVDTQTEAVNKLRRDHFSSWRQPPRVDEIPTMLPGVFKARRRPVGGREIGHLRIYTFMVTDADGFIDEFVRLAGQLPPDGLIIDVRGNGGGNILAAERLLQVLCPRTIEPEPAQFISSPLTRQLCRFEPNGAEGPGLDLAPWRPSLEQAIETGATYSSGYPITPRAAANDRGQQYRGPAALITDARCYSATDLFAAGFQDHDIGPVIGTAMTTGAGGANVWTHDLLRYVFADHPDNPFGPLPGGATFRVAARRTIRVGERAGSPLEDLGVQLADVDHFHRLTRDDLLNGNKDLIAFTAGKLHADTVHVHGIEITETLDDHERVLTVTTTCLDRVDAFVNNRPHGSQDATDDGVATFHMSTTATGTIRLDGYSHDRLAVSRQLVLTEPHIVIATTVTNPN